MIHTRSFPISVALIGLAALAAVGAGLAASSVIGRQNVDSTAPPFSRRLSPFTPGAPLVTCDVGQFEDGPQRWYVRPLAAGELRVDVHAVGSNPVESGGLAARLYDPRGALLAESVVTYPTGGAGPASNVVPLRASVLATSIYRIEVRPIAPPPPLGQARHYRLGFSGTPVEVGVNSPALPRWLEGLNFGRQVFHVNVDAGERLLLTISAGEGQPIPFLTVEIRDETSALLDTVTSRTWDPFDVVLRPGGARTLRVVTSGNHHFTLDKRSGSDRGIYFDACPPQGRP